MATRSGIPARTMLRIAVRRKSWGIRPGHPAFLQAFSQAPRKSRMGSPRRWNTQGMIRPSCRWKASVRARCASRSARSSGVKGKALGSSFFVVPGSSRTTPASTSTWAQVRGRTSEGTRRVQRLDRADAASDRDAIVAMTIEKAKRVIDEQGDQIFGDA